MRNWTVSELERIESDLEMLAWIVADNARFNEQHGRPVERGIPAADAAWLAERIDIRAKHATNAIERCDACPDETKIPVMVCVDEMWDEMGAPTNLSYTYLCRFHLRNY